MYMYMYTDLMYTNMHVPHYAYIALKARHFILYGIFAQHCMQIKIAYYNSNTSTSVFYMYLLHIFMYMHTCKQVMKHWVASDVDFERKISAQMQ